MCARTSSGRRRAQPRRHQVAQAVPRRVACACGRPPAHPPCPVRTPFGGSAFWPYAARTPGAIMVRRASVVSFAHHACRPCHIHRVQPASTLVGARPPSIGGGAAAAAAAAEIESGAAVNWTKCACRLQCCSVADRAAVGGMVRMSRMALAEAGWLGVWRDVSLACRETRRTRSGRRRMPWRWTPSAPKVRGPCRPPMPSLALCKGVE